MPELNMGTLSCVYSVLFFLGLGYAIFITITGGLADIDMPDVDIDVPQIDLPGDVDIPGADIHVGGGEGFSGGIDAPDVSLSPLSPITISTFITAFGGVGLISTQFFGVDGRISLLWSLGSGLALAGMMYVVVSRFLIGSQGSSEVRAGELLGIEAEVVVPIGARTPGQVVYVTKSGRMSSMARSATGEPIPRGEFVTIVHVQGPQVLVRPMASETEEEM